MSKLDISTIRGDRILTHTTCTKCRLYAHDACSQIVNGHGNTNASIMFVGEAPGETEDNYGIPYVGKSGRLLRKLINTKLELGDSDIFFSNVVRCHPINNRNPERDEIHACFPYLRQEILKVNPILIVTTGNFSSKAIIGSKFKSITVDRRKVFHTDLGTVVPIAHPASIRGTDAEIQNKKQLFILDFTILKEIYNELIDSTPDKKQLKCENSFEDLFNLE